MSIGKNIAAARKLKGLTQRQLALKVGVTQAAVTGWETGKRDPKLRQLPALCAALECSVPYLLRSDDTDILPPEGGACNGA